MYRFIAVLLAFLPIPALAAPKVVATIAPLAGIATAVMEGVGTPQLLISNNSSPHTYQLKPSDAAMLASTDVLVWDGMGLENFLAGKLATLAPQAKLIGMMDEGVGMHHLAARKGTEWEPEAEEEGEHHDHGADDPHAWLNPENAIVLADRLAATLADLDSANAVRYHENAQRFKTNTQRLDTELKQSLAPLAGRGFVVFHDAYQYFEQRYGLKGLGAITLAPDVPPSSQRLAELQQRLKTAGAACVFAEPQFSRALVNTLAENAGVKTGILNPDASDLPITPLLYADYMRRLAASFNECLANL